LALKVFTQIEEEEEVFDFKGSITCDSPNEFIESFDGNITI